MAVPEKMHPPAESQNDVQILHRHKVKNTDTYRDTSTDAHGERERLREKKTEKGREGEARACTETDRQTCRQLESIDELRWKEWC